MEKTRVIFSAENEVNYMRAVVKVDGEEIELYAEIELPYETDENGDVYNPDHWDDEHYPILKNEIIKQAKEKGIDPDSLKFW